MRGDILDCIICGETTQYEKDYYFCNNCQFVFKNNKLVLSSTDEKQRYMLHNNTIEDTKYLEYFKEFVNKIDPYLSGKIGLDYGSGLGKVLEYVMETFFDYSIDSYDKYFHNNVILKTGYDFVVCTEVIEHILNPIKFIKEIDEYLNSGCELVFMTKFRNMSRESFYDWWYIRDVTHIGFYNITTFEYLASKFNYSIIFTDNDSIVVLRKN